jgi:hypothetical protein
VVRLAPTTKNGITVFNNNQVISLTNSINLLASLCAQTGTSRILSATLDELNCKYFINETDHSRNDEKNMRQPPSMIIPVLKNIFQVLRH